MPVRAERGRTVHVLEGETYLTSREVAQKFGVHGGTLRNWRCDGVDHVPFIKLGASVLYRERDVAEYLGRVDRH